MRLIRSFFSVLALTVLLASKVYAVDINLDRAWCQQNKQEQNSLYLRDVGVLGTNYQALMTWDPAANNFRLTSYDTEPLNPVIMRVEPIQSFDAQTSSVSTIRRFRTWGYKTTAVTVTAPDSTVYSVPFYNIENARREFRTNAGAPAQGVYQFAITDDGSVINHNVSVSLDPLPLLTNVAISRAANDIIISLDPVLGAGDIIYHVRVVSLDLNVAVFRRNYSTNTMTVSDVPLSSGENYEVSVFAIAENMLTVRPQARYFSTHRVW